jgi:3-oxoacyl-[acyl-carrier-protein] synthase III
VNTGRYAQITGWGMCVPERVVTNEDLARVMETSDEWIFSRTGIHERRVAQGERETTAGLATRAARDALLVADITPGDVDLVIVATVTPEYMFPSTASCVQDAIGASKAGAFDLSAGCSGFLYAVSIANHVIHSGGADHVLVIGAETLSKIVDWTDRDTCVLFGDGAGAVVLSASAYPCGVMSTVMGSDGSGGDLLLLPAGGSRYPASIETISSGDHFLKMNGREVFRFATTVMARATEEVVREAGWHTSDLSLVIPHQANSRIIDSAAKRLNLPSNKFFVNLDRYGNTSSASIPIALCEAINQGRVRAGDKLVLVGFGAGLTWAAATLLWGMPMPVKPKSGRHRLIANMRFSYAAARSTSLRVSRRAYDATLGPEGSDGMRGRVREHVDRWRNKYVKRNGKSPS